jgi:hypothetical protein
MNYKRVSVPLRGKGRKLLGSVAKGALTDGITLRQVSVPLRGKGRKLLVILKATIIVVSNLKPVSFRPLAGKR